MDTGTSQAAVGPRQIAVGSLVYVPTVPTLPPDVGRVTELDPFSKAGTPHARVESLISGQTYEYEDDDFALVPSTLRTAVLIRAETVKQLRKIRAEVAQLAGTLTTEGEHAKQQDKSAYAVYTAQETHVRFLLPRLDEAVRRVNARIEGEPA